MKSFLLNTTEVRLNMDPEPHLDLDRVEHWSTETLIYLLKDRHRRKVWYDTAIDIRSLPESEDYDF